MTPEQRVLRSRLGAHTSWANTTDRSARTEAARRAAWNRFDRLADPEGVLSDEERSRRAEHLRRANFTRMALASSRSRAAKKKRAA